MCCFSDEVIAVSGTNIYARLDGDRQVLAYSMFLDVAKPVAMVLPLPVAAGPVTFIDLSGTPDMFEQLAALFVMPSRGGPFLEASLGLEVHEVGSFLASFVPTRADFARLDPRFRISDRLFAALPHYADHGFAVFQLAQGKQTIHPMALTFPTREPGKLFFPTVHVHDGEVHATADFDHALYYQHPRCRELGDQVAFRPVAQAYAGVTLAGQPIARRELHARLPNADTWIAV